MKATLPALQRGDRERIHRRALQPPGQIAVVLAVNHNIVNVRLFASGRDIALPIAAVGKVEDPNENEEGIANIALHYDKTPEIR